MINLLMMDIFPSKVIKYLLLTLWRRKNLENVTKVNTGTKYHPRGYKCAWLV